MQVGELEYKIGANDAEFRRVLDKSEAYAKQKSQTISQTVAVFAGNVISSAVQSATSALIQGGKAVLDYSSNLEQARIGFTSMLGSAQAADKHLKELETFAKTTPFRFHELVLASQNMQGLGHATKDILPMLTDIGDILSGSGRMDAFPQAIKALNDIKAKGRLAGDETTG